MPDVEEEKPEPDLDELLELFREPEEEPRRKAIPGAAWLMAAFVLSLVGVWLALQIANGHRAAKSTGPPLLPTKVSDRKPREEGDVAEDYTARCQKGMTAIQVEWILADFKNEGLDDGPGSFRAIIEAILEPLDIDDANTQQLLELSIGTEPAVRLKAASLLWALHQQSWYDDALADAFRLSAQQRHESKASGRQFVGDCEGDFLKIESAGAPANTGGPERSYLRDRVDDHLSRTDLLFPATGLLEPSYWLAQPNSAPSERVQLSPRQQEVMGLLKSSDAQAPDRLRGLREVLPVVAGQKFPADGNDIVGLAEAMHPAQLKVLLLLEPKVATDLAAALEKANK
ncbi:hypothetical protein [Luteolibacter soli]|uniref:HEAT repeat domain-containing protein n=1 Tax=Luteolibacter soli TaxID=3135280 RepID=A0ABU9B2L0_9BACT